MEESIKKIIERLKTRSLKYDWHGYTHSNCRSKRFNHRKISGQAFYRMCLTTIVPKIHIIIQINRVYQTGYWKKDKEEFDQQKHFFWYELKISEVMKKNGHKTILDVICAKEDPDIDLFQNLFDEILKLTNFEDKLIEGSSKKALDALISVI